MLKKPFETKEDEKKQSISNDKFKAGKCLFKKITAAELDLVGATLKKERSKLALFREPTIDEMAVNLGQNPQILEEAMRLLGWRPQSWQEAQKIAEDAINLAAWLRWKQKDDHDPQLDALYKETIGNASVNTLKKAQDIFQNYPFLVPNIYYSRIEWPKITRDIWSRVFQSKPPATTFLG